MKYLGKAPIYCTPPNEKYEDSWERVFGTFKKSSAMGKSENAGKHDELRRESEGQLREA